MSRLDEFCNAWRPHALSVLRVMTGLLFLQHGTAKLLGFPAVPGMDNLDMMSPGGIAGYFEFAGGLLVIAGLFTRPVAFVLSGVMAAAYFIAHAGRSFYPIINQGELAVLYCFVFLYLAFAGGGTWSVDSLLARRKT